AGVAAAPGGPEPGAPTNSQATSGDIQKGQATGPTSGAPGATGATGATGSQETQPKQQAQAKPDLKVNLSADKTAIGAGDSIVYKLELENAGDGQATGVVLTDKLPAGASVDTARVKAGSGQVSVESGTVKVDVGDLAAGAKTTVEIPVSVNPGTGSNLSNQASATYKEAPEPVQSNAYIAQVAAPLAGPPAAQP